VRWRSRELRGGEAGSRGELRGLAVGKAFSGSAEREVGFGAGLDAGDRDMVVCFG